MGGLTSCIAEDLEQKSNDIHIPATNNFIQRLMQEYARQDTATMKGQTRCARDEARSVHHQK
jgi:hypothetical protein